jgi:diaminopimelate epimerase
MLAHPIRFTKMHGLGNDFVVINTLDQSFDSAHLPITTLSNRHLGIGFDQLLLIEKSQQADFFCRIFNADGSEAEQCGNGLRCVARFIHEEKLVKKPALQIATKAGIYAIEIRDYDHISVSMGIPKITENLIELALEHPIQSVSLSVLSIGNPHAIMKVESIHSDLPDALGATLTTHSYFPQGANIGLMQVVNPHQILLRTFERGSGETFACGSNACAAVVAGIMNGWLQHSVQVQFHHGSLMIEWEGKDKPIHMTGPATKVFSGLLTLDNRN